MSEYQYPAPSIRRRLICMIYESFLLFGVVFVSGLLFSLISKNWQADLQRQAIMAGLFLVIGLYFCYFWCRSGQTLAMKTWRIRLVNQDSTLPLGAKKAVIRYCVAWMWFIPALALAHFLGLRPWPITALVGGGMLFWALLALTNADRQFIHDKVAGTRLIQLPKPSEKESEPD